MIKKIIAITGPSGAGKTTLGNNLCKYHQIIIPQHCTTRQPREDDLPGFYNYLNHSDYKKLVDENEFLITSGDGPIVDKNYGNFYGVLQKDCEDAFNKCNQIILFVSYKDIENLNRIKDNEYNIEILNLTFYDIEKGMRIRIQNNPFRKHSQQDIDNRINCALDYQEKYGELLKHYAHTIYTDCNSIQQTYEHACKILKL